MHTHLQRILGYALVLLALASCVPEENEFMSPIPVATDPTEVSYTSFMATWNASLGVTSYIIEVAEDENFGKLLDGFPAQIDSTQKEVVGLTDGTTYYFRLRGIFNGSNTEYSNIIAVRTRSFNENSPTGLQVLSNGVTDFWVSWTPELDAEGYLVNLALDSAFKNPVSNYFQRDVGRVDSLQLEELQPNTTYYFRVKSYRTNSSGQGLLYSGNSEALENTTMRPTPPQVLPPSDITPIRFTANWRSVANTDVYLLDVSSDSTFNTFPEGLSQVAVFADTSASFEGLDLNTDYYYRVMARVKQVDSDFSATQFVNSSLKQSCVIASATYNNSYPTLFTYDGQNRLTNLQSASRFLSTPYHGAISKYTFEYSDPSSRLIRVAYGTDFFDTPVDTLYFFYNQDETLDSVYVNGSFYDFSRKFEYQEDGYLSSYKEWIIFSTGEVYDLVNHAYTTDESGNVTHIEGTEFYFNYTDNNYKYRELSWEFRYDDKLNPLVSLPQAAHQLVPFSINAGGTLQVDHLPFVPTNNIKLGIFGTTTEIVAFDYNDHDFVENQLGFFSVSYEYQGCD